MAEDTTEAIPPPLPDDDEDLVWALTTASTMWNRGDRDEAIKWVKRALEHAADNDLDDRALDLGKLVAELAKKPLPSASAAPSAKPSAAPPPPPPAAAKPESKKKTGLTGKHAAIRDAAPAAKGSAKATGKHKPLGANAAAAVLSSAKSDAAAPKPVVAPSVPRPSTTPRPMGASASEPRRPTSPPPASIPTKRDDAKDVASKPGSAASDASGSRDVSESKPEPVKAAPPPLPPEATKPTSEEKPAASETKSVAPPSESASSNGNAGAAKPAPGTPRPSMLPTRPGGSSASISPARSVSPPGLGASPSMRPGALPALKAPPLPAITKDPIVPVPRADTVVSASAETPAEKPAATHGMPLLQSLRVFVTADANGPRIVVARDGHTAPDGSVEAVLVATHPTGDLLALFRE